MRILIVGGGGREHAIAWKIAQSPLATKLYCAPGNAGTEGLAEPVPIGAEDLDGLLAFARDNEIDLTVAGPEAPLALGLADRFEEAGLPVFGPRRDGAQLESSKSFTKDLLARKGVPTAGYETFTDAAAAREYIRKAGGPLVVKADGLAAGKGVLICQTVAEAEAAVDRVMVRRDFGTAGDQVVIEECLTGEEASFIAFTDGKTVLPLATSQDHKRIYDGDQGLNTGGMGAYSPAPIIDEAMHARVVGEVFAPVVEGLKEAGIDFRGVLYAGLMIQGGVPYVLEFNVRLGDPEAQPLLMRLKSDIVPVLTACAEGKLAGHTLEWDDRPAVCVVMASGGYPGKYEKGIEIAGLDDAGAMEDTMVFHAGTKRRDGRVLTAGGRVLGVTALGDDIRQAIDRAYEACGRIGWRGVHYRRDIGYRALNRRGE